MSGLLKRGALTLVVLFALAACVEDKQLAEGGIGGTGISNGPINGFGSIIVNGIHFDVSQAQIWMNGEAAVEEDLQHGMVVTVYGELDETRQTGVATKVLYSDSLKGSIESLDNDNQHLTVLGQLVNVDELTVFDNLRWDSVSPGMMVAISGILDADGALLASYVGYISGLVEDSSDSLTGQDSGSPNNQVPTLGTGDAALSGIVADVNVSAMRFNLGAQQVDYAQAEFVDMQPTELRNGVNVSIQGGLSNGLFVALRISPSLGGVVSGDRVSLHGMIGALERGNRFELRGVTVEVNEQTAYLNGDASSIAVNSRVVVAGEVDDVGSVIADEIRFRPTNLVRIAAQVGVVNQRGLTLAGVVFAEVGDSTLMLDSSEAALRSFSLQDVAVGDNLIVYGYPSLSGIVLARVERVDSLPRQSISGPVGGFISPPVFEVLGVTVDASMVPDQEALFAEFNTGDWVTVSGDLSGSVLTAQEVRIGP